MLIQYQGHWGDLNPQTGECTFYDALFKDIEIAARHLKHVPPGPSYTTVMIGNTLVFTIKEYEPNESTMEVHRLNQWATVPRRASEGAAGYDLASAEITQIAPGERRLVSTGLSIKVPPGLYGRIAPRSGLAVKHGIQVGAGVVDADYRGEVKVLLFNQSQEPFNIETGDRIAQLILERHETPAVLEVTELSGGDTGRGAGGFGSTGV